MLASDIVAEELPTAVREDNALYSSCVAGAVSEDTYLDGLRQAGLVDAEVRERIRYDESQLKAFIESELSDTKEGSSSCCGGGKPVALGAGTELASQLVGKVWSAKIFARKPVG